MKSVFIFSLALFSIVPLICFPQSVTTTVQYDGAQSLGCCTVCGNDYWCINNVGGCGTASVCDTRTFFDPIPPGNIVSGITINFYSADCYGNTITATISGTTFPTVNEGNTGCLCSNNPCGLSASASVIYNCQYVYGGNNTIQLCTGVDICMDRVELVISYTPAGGPGTWTWNGSVNTDWFVPCNWDKNTIPNSQSDVVIPGGTPNQPTIAAMGAACNTLFIDSNNGALLTITVADALTVTQ